MGAKLTITAKRLTVEGAKAKTKIYDGDAHPAWTSPARR